MSEKTLNEWYESLSLGNADTSHLSVFSGSPQTMVCDKCGSREPLIDVPNDTYWQDKWQQWHFAGECQKPDPSRSYHVVMRTKGQDGYEDLEVDLREALVALGLLNVPTNS